MNAARVAGFTGRRDGMTAAQLTTVSRLLEGFDVLHSGDCVGADEQAYGAAVDLGLWTVGHPPTPSGLRAWCRYDEERPARAFMVRNRAIVDACGVLIAAPPSEGEIARGSGTWSTIRYARSQRRPVRMVRPDGTVRSEDEGEPVSGQTGDQQ